MTRDEVILGLLEHPELAAKMKIVGRQLQVYQLLNRGTDPVTSKDLATHLDIHYHTANHILMELANKGYAKRVVVDNEERPNDTRHHGYVSTKLYGEYLNEQQNKMVYR